MMKLAPHYLVYADLGELGIAGSDPMEFSDACDVYLENRTCEQDAVVFRIDPPAGGKSGMAVDVTEDVNDALRRRFRNRPYDFPEWLMAA